MQLLDEAVAKKRMELPDSMLSANFCSQLGKI